MQSKGPLVSNRLDRVGKKLLTGGLEALLFLDLNNIRYLSGFSGSDGALIVKNGESLLLVDGRYTTQAKQEAPQAQVFQYRDKIDGIVEVLADSRIKGLGFEAAAISFENYKNLKVKVPDVRLQALSGEECNIRAVKDENEICLIREAAGRASKTLAAMLASIKPGVKEQDVALELEYRMRRNGAEGVSFSTIVASGANSALPHAKPGTKKLAGGDFVTIDYGAVYQGYHSDETCTLVLGYATHRQKEVYDCVKKAHDRALAAVRAGIACSEIDRIARDSIREAGMERYFSHGTGHGVGLDVHESPRIAPPSKAVLEEGMVVTIEPGIYIPGMWGVRIEDMALVKNEGCEVLTKMPKSFTIL